jgi:hypothetical protein
LYGCVSYPNHCFTYKANIVKSGFQIYGPGSAETDGESSTLCGLCYPTCSRWRVAAGLKTWLRRRREPPSACWLMVQHWLQWCSCSCQSQTPGFARCGQLHHRQAPPHKAGAESAIRRIDGLLDEMGAGCHQFRPGLDPQYAKDRACGSRRVLRRTGRPSGQSRIIINRAYICINNNIKEVRT